MRMTTKEREVLDHLAAAWNAWCDLSGKVPGDNTEFQTAIHDAQKLIALRVARRADPDVWRTPAAESIQSNAPYHYPPPRRP